MNVELTVKEIGRRIYFIRGHRIMLDSDLAELYQVPTKQLNFAVRRNERRFPSDFMFQLDADEYERLRLQTETSKNQSRGGRRYLPYAFTEHGVTMLASVLNSERAIQVNLAIVRAFVRLRELLESHRHLALKLERLESKYDSQFKVVFDAIRQLMAVGSPLTQRRIKGLSEK
jgi:phage regulator Rha-like protein